MHNQVLHKCASIMQPLPCLGIGHRPAGIPTDSAFWLGWRDAWLRGSRDDVPVADRGAWSTAAGSMVAVFVTVAGLWTGLAAAPRNGLPLWPAYSLKPGGEAARYGLGQATADVGRSGMLAAPALLGVR